ncbi:MAG: hypothetical protein GY757_57025 [bacterium]|nr:hypothetical protein [bacterium]
MKANQNKSGTEKPPEVFNFTIGGKKPEIKINKVDSINPVDLVANYGLNPADNK